MKKLIFTLIMVLVTTATFAKFHHPTIEDMEVGYVLHELRAQGDIILPEIHVYAYSQQDTIVPPIKVRERKHNYGEAVSQTAKETPGCPGKGEIVNGVAKQNREQAKTCKHARPMNMHQNGARPAQHGTTPPRTHNTQRGGRK